MKYILIICLFLNLKGYSQNSIPGPNTSIFNQLNVGKGSYQTTDPNAWLEIGSLNTTKGFLPPRTDTSRVGKTEGNLIYNIANKKYYYWNLLRWTEMGSGGGGNTTQTQTYTIGVDIPTGIIIASSVFVGKTILQLFKDGAPLMDIPINNTTGVADFTSIQGIFSGKLKIIYY